jgi:DNA polymerase-3 subunit beta
MKLTCSQAELNQALTLVSRAISSRSSHPILSTVLLQADATTGQLTLTGYDLALGLQSTIPASVETSGTTALPAHPLGGIVARSPFTPPGSRPPSPASPAVTSCRQPIPTTTRTCLPPLAFP